MGSGEMPKIGAGMKAMGVMILAAALWTVLIRDVLDGWTGVLVSPVIAWIMWTFVAKYAVNNPSGKVWVFTFVAITVNGMLFGWLMGLFQFATLISLCMAMALATLLARQEDLFSTDARMFLDSIQDRGKQ